MSWSLEVQFVVGPGINREPVLAVDLLPPRREFGIEILFVAVLLADVGHGLAVRLHNLKVVVVDPDSSLKISLLAHNLFGSDVEHITVDLIFLLLAHIKNVVFRQVGLGQHERQYGAGCPRNRPGPWRGRPVRATIAVRTPRSRCRLPLSSNITSKTSWYCPVTVSPSRVSTFTSWR